MSHVERGHVRTERIAYRRTNECRRRRRTPSLFSVNYITSVFFVCYSFICLIEIRDLFSRFRISHQSPPRPLRRRGDRYIIINIALPPRGLPWRRRVALSIGATKTPWPRTTGKTENGQYFFFFYSLLFFGDFRFVSISTSQRFFVDVKSTLSENDVVFVVFVSDRTKSRRRPPRVRTSLAFELSG